MADGDRLGVVVIAVAAAIVVTIVMLAHADRAPGEDRRGSGEVVARQTADLGDIARINDSGVRILHAARALRKVAVGK